MDALKVVALCLCTMAAWRVVAFLALTFARTLHEHLHAEAPELEPEVTEAIGFKLDNLPPEECDEPWEDPQPSQEFNDHG